MSEHAEIYEHIMVRRSDANIVFSKLRGLHRQLGPEERIRGDHHICTKQYVEAIRVVTVTPEIPGAYALIKITHGIGAVAAIGHSGATYEQALASISAGARHVTHLYQCHEGPASPRPRRSRSSPIRREGHCRTDRQELHLHSGTLRMVITDLAEGGQLGRSCLVTDAMRAAGSPEGQYILSDQFVEVRNDAARLADGRLAGSLLTLDQTIRIAMETSGKPLEEAVQRETANPARVLGQQHRMGALRPGYLGDLVRLDASGSVRATVREGRCLYEAKADA